MASEEDQYRDANPDQHQQNDDEQNEDATTVVEGDHTLHPKTKPPRRKNMPGNSDGRAGCSDAAPPRSAFNLRSGSLAIRSARDRMVASAGGLAVRIVEARNLLDSDFSGGEAREHVMHLKGMEDTLREAATAFQELLDRAVAMTQETNPDMQDRLYNVVMDILPRTAQTLGLTGPINPTELLQFAAEHLADLRVVRKPLELEERAAALTLGSGSVRTVNSQPLGDVLPPTNHDQQRTNGQKDEQLSTYSQSVSRVGTPLQRRMSNLIQRGANGTERSVRDWVQQSQPPRGAIPTQSNQQPQAATTYRRHQQPPPRPVGGTNPLAPTARAPPTRGGVTTFETVRLQPPTFTGKPEDWTTFWAYFQRAVDDKPIPGFEKQLHLLRCLKEGSPARRAVEVYPPSDGNYPVVVQMLKERFGDTEDLQRAIRAQLLHLAPARDNVSSLTAVIDEFERGVCQLEQLGANVDDASFGPLLESKLPVRILTEMRIREGMTSRKWTVREFRSAVSAQVRCMRSAESALAAMKEPERRHETEKRQDHRADMDRAGRAGRTGREPFQRAFLVRDHVPDRPPRPPDPPGRTEAANPIGQPSPRPDQPPRGTPPRSSDRQSDRNTGPPGRYPGPCSLCQRDGHRPSECPEYRTPQARRQRVVEQGRCLRCLASEHNSSQCHRERPCRWCQRTDHHALICWNRSADADTRAPHPPTLSSANRALLIRSSEPPMSAVPGPGTVDRRRQRVRRRGKLTGGREWTRSSPNEDLRGEVNPGDEQRALTMVGQRLPAHLMMCQVIAAAEERDSNFRTTLLLDTGSHVDCVETALVQQLKLTQLGCRPLTVQVFGGDKKRIRSGTYRLRIKRRDGAWESLEVSEVPQICTPIRTELIEPGSNPDDELRTITATTQPQILIGIRKFWNFITGFRRSDQGVHLIDTVFGTVICGETFRAVCGCQPTAPVFSILPTGDDQREQMPAANAVEQFWSLETIGIRDDPSGDADAEAVIQFQRSVRQLTDGRYSIRLPWRDSHPALPDNFSLAYRRLATMLQRLQRMPEVLKQYKAVIDEQLENGIIEETAIGEGRREHFIPHQAVITPKKLRVVYDASAHGKGAPSLNDCLLRGPVWLPDLAGMLIRFRACRVPVIADVEKAFLMVGIEEEDRNVCKFLWVRDPTRPLTTSNLAPFRFRRLAFGLTPSPFCLAAVVRHHLRKYGTELAEQLIRDTYVDNVLIPAESREEAGTKAREAKRMFAEARMNLREFLTNDKGLNDGFAEADFLGKTTAKVLGVEWNAESDDLHMHYPGEVPGVVTSNTRRGVLKIIASLFDPLGLLVPSTLAAKRFFQKLWDSTHNWDTPLEKGEAMEWQAILTSWDGVVNTIPRRLPAEAGLPLRLHVFTDASETAYAAAAYIQSDGPNGTESRLVMAKSRLKPKKAAETFTIPRMELMGILLGVRLATFIRAQLHHSITAEHIWSDSMIALHWVRNRTPQPQFIANRLLEIRRAATTTFHYVRTGENPADCATRGITPADLQRNERWWTGPSWLNRPEPEWPTEFQFGLDSDETESEGEKGENSTLLAGASANPDSGEGEFPFSLLHRCSRWTKAQRVMAWALRFIHNARRRRQQGHSATNAASTDQSPDRNDSEPTPQGVGTPPLQADELYNATSALTRAVQLQSKLPTGIRSELDRLGIQRLTSRIGQCAEPDLSTPIILPKRSRLGALIADDIHVRLHHAGAEGTLAEFLRGWWTPSARQQVRKVIGQCLRCRRLMGMPYSLPPMPPLPADRVQRRLPFESVGLDYLGPTATLEGDGQRRKVWVLLITCLTTRAIYIDATRDLSAASLIAVLRRFIARRGAPTRILSDNAPTFTIVGKTLSAFGIANTSPIAFADSRGIQWRFTPQHTPWAGGIFERAVQLVKRALQKTLGGNVLDYDSFATLLAEIEATVNSRPLTYVPSAAGDPHPLRPIDFLQENNRLSVEPPTVPPPLNKVRDQPHVQLTRQWRDSQQRLEHFWRRWHREYLMALREKAGWAHPARRIAAPGSPKIGDVVLIEDKFHPRNLWAMGRITEVKGSGGQIRSVMIRMPNGRIWGRPINKISPLEVPETEEQVQDVPTDDGENQRNRCPPTSAEPMPAPTGADSDGQRADEPTGEATPTTILNQPIEDREPISEDRETRPEAPARQSREAQAVQENQIRRSTRTRKKRGIWSPERQPTRGKGPGRPLISLILLTIAACLTGTIGCQPAIRLTGEFPIPPAGPPTEVPCTLRCSARGIAATSHRELTKLEICCPDGCWATVPKSTVIHYELPAEELIHGYECNGQCWWGSGPPFNHTQKCPARTECELIDCTICWELLANPSCNPRWASGLFGFGTALFLAALGCICPVISRLWSGATLFSKAVAWGARYPIHLINWATGRHIPTPTSDQIERKVRRGARKARAEVREVQQRLQLARRARAMARAWRNPEQGRRMPNGHVLAGIIPLLLLSGLTMATRPLSVAVRSEDCARTPAGLKCAGTAATIVTLLPADQTTSFIIRTPQDELLGAVRLRLASITMVCTPRTESWLRSYAISTTAVKRCPAAGSCTGRLCGLVNTGRRESIPELSELNHRPGHSKCLHSSGFWGHTCVLPQSACLFYRWAAVPTSSTVFEEFSCLEWDLQISTWVGLETNNGQTDFQQLVLHPGVPEKWGNMTLSVIPTSLPPMPALSAHFITNGRSVAMGKPIPSDLHCADEATARDFDRCQISIGACQHCAPNHDNGSIHCHCKDLDLDRIINDPEHRLPLDVARLHLHNDGSAVRAEFQYSPVQVQVQLHGVELVSEYSDTKCWVERPSLAGCYRCITGATFNATCRTDHGTALAQITCTDGTAFALHCGSNDSTTTEAIPFDRAEVYTECRARCPAGSTTFRLQGELAFIPKRQQFGFRQRDSASGQIEPGSGFSFDLSNWGFDPFPLLRLLLNGPSLMTALTVGVIALIAVYLFLRFNPHFRLYRALLTATIGATLLSSTTASSTDRASNGMTGAIRAPTPNEQPTGPQLVALFLSLTAGALLIIIKQFGTRRKGSDRRGRRRSLPRARADGVHQPRATNFGAILSLLCSILFVFTLSRPLEGAIDSMQTVAAAIARRSNQSEAPRRPPLGGGPKQWDGGDTPPLNTFPFPPGASFSFFFLWTISDENLPDDRMSEEPFNNGGFDWNPPQQKDNRPDRTTQLGRIRPLPPRSDAPTAADEINALGVGDWATNPWARTKVEQYIRQRERDGFLLVQLRGDQQASPPAILGLLSAERQTMTPGWSVARYFGAQRERPLLHPDWPCIYLGGGTVGSSRKSRAKQTGGWRPWRYGLEHCSWAPLEEMVFLSERDCPEADGALVSPDQLDGSATAVEWDELPEQQHHHRQQQQHHQQQQQHHHQQQQQHHHQQQHQPHQPLGTEEDSAKHDRPTPPPPPEKDPKDENATKRDPSPWGGFGKTPPRRPKTGLSRPIHEASAQRAHSGQRATPTPPPWEEEILPSHHSSSTGACPLRPPSSLPPPSHPPLSIIPPTSSSTNRPIPFSMSYSSDPYPRRERETGSERRSRLMRSTSTLAEDIREELIRQQHNRAGQPVASWRETADGVRLRQMLEKYQNGAARLAGWQRQELRDRFPELPPPMRRPADNSIPRLASVVVVPRETGDETPEPLTDMLKKLRAEEDARRSAAQTELHRADQLKEAREELEEIVRKNEEEERERKAQRAAELKKAEEEEKARKKRRAAELKKAAADMSELLAGAKWSGGPARATSSGGRRVRAGQPGAAKLMKEIDEISLAETEEEEAAPTPPRPASVAKSARRKFGDENDGTLTFVRGANGQLIATEDDDSDDGALTVRNSAGPSTWRVPKGPSGRGRRL